MQRALPNRLAVLIAIAACHVVGLLVLENGVEKHVRPTASEMFVTFFEKPVVLEESNALPSPDLSRRTALIDPESVTLQIAPIDVDYSTTRNGGAQMSAPSLQRENTQALPQTIAESALLPGEAATVVLRVEVLPSGEPGRIEVDVSSGSRQIDEAAIRYAMTQRWLAGRVGRTPQAMWIRWGVHLQA